MAISFQTQDVKFKLKEVTRLKNWIAKIVKLEGKKLGEVNYVFTSDEEVLKANIRFLNHSTYTDIITFDSCEGDWINGDIIISIDRIKENAAKFEAAFETELRRVIIHGILHLCGYKDKNPKDAVIMREKEDRSLKKY